jgi:hypothetical protein
MSSRAGWHAPTDLPTVAKRAGGRRRFNAVRQLRAELRRRELRRLIAELNAAGGCFLLTHGAQAGFARRLGVHRSTICRDVRRLLRRDLELETARRGFACLGFVLTGGRIIPFRDFDPALRELWRQHDARMAELGEDAPEEVLDADPGLSALHRRISARERVVCDWVRAR